MLGTTYYHQTIRKYVAVFGTLFNDINVVRRDASDVIKEQIKVPIAYSPRDRWILRLRRARGVSGTDEAVQCLYHEWDLILLPLHMMELEN